MQEGDSVTSNLPLLSQTID